MAENDFRSRSSQEEWLGVQVDADGTGLAGQKFEVNLGHQEHLMCSFKYFFLKIPSLFIKPN